MISSPSSDPNRRRLARYFAGLDLGQANDFTAVAVVREFTYEQRSEHGWVEYQPSVYQLGHLQRVRGVPYPAIVRQVQELIANPLWAGNIRLAIDQTGVGRPVADMFGAAGIEFDGVTITGGTAETNPETGVWHVPKLTLVSHLQSLFHEGRLLIQRHLPEADALTRELLDFRATFSDAGHLSFGARAGRHDDLVLALAIAVWRGRRKPTVGEAWELMCNRAIADVQPTPSVAEAHSTEGLFQQFSPQAAEMIELNVPAGIDCSQVCTAGGGAHNVQVGPDGQRTVLLPKAHALAMIGSAAPSNVCWREANLQLSATIVRQPDVPGIRVTELLRATEDAAPRNPLDRGGLANDVIRAIQTGR